MKARVEISDWTSAPGTAPPGQIVFAIGDIHGSADLLEILHRKIVEIADAELAMSASPQVVVVRLGDYIDRGPDSGRVLAMIGQGLGHPRIEEHNLRGNHDQVFEHVLRFVRHEPTDFVDCKMWFDFGGDATLRSLGWGKPIADWPQIENFLSDALDPLQDKALHDLEDYAEAGDYLFVHAGVDPQAPLDGQLRPDLGLFKRYGIFWMRHQPDEGSAHGRIVVHGHTPKPGPDIQPYRIGIDTSADRTGILTMIELRDNKMRFIQAVDKSKAG